MEKHALLFKHFDQQTAVIAKLCNEIVTVDVSVYEQRFVFALKAQRFYNAIESLFKQIAQAFEGHIDAVDNFPIELLQRMSIDVPKIRPAVLSNPSLILLHKLRSFRHFLYHTYDCELNPNELRIIQQKLIHEYVHVYRS